MQTTSDPIKQQIKIIFHIFNNLDLKHKSLPIQILKHHRTQITLVTFPLYSHAFVPYYTTIFVCVFSYPRQPHLIFAHQQNVHLYMYIANGHIRINIYKTNFDYLRPSIFLVLFFLFLFSSLLSLNTL